MRPLPSNEIVAGCWIAGSVRIGVIRYPGGSRNFCCSSTGDTGSTGFFGERSAPANGSKRGGVAGVAVAVAVAEGAAGVSACCAAAAVDVVWVCAVAFGVGALRVGTHAPPATTTVPTRVRQLRDVRAVRVIGRAP